MALVGDELNVVTNFGLLKRVDDGWHLDCEELFGGLLTEARFGSVPLASTSVGFFRRGDETCGWEASADGASNTWFLDFDLVVTGKTENVYALVSDRETQDTKVERAEVGGGFETIATFSADTGLRKLRAGGDSTHVYVAGYGFSPRTWNLFVAVDGGGFEAFSFDAEGEDFELSALQVDPKTPERLWIRGAMPPGEPDAVFRFDASDGSLERVFTLQDEERLSAIAFDAGDAYVAARPAETSTGEAVSSITQIDVESLETIERTEVDAALSCFSVQDAVWYACDDDFARASPWLVARSSDRGANWIPELTVDDLGAVSSCGEVCAETAGWLYGLFGSFVPPPNVGDGRRVFDAGSGGDDETPRHDGGIERSPPARGGCGCRLQASQGSPGKLAFGALLILLAALLARARSAE